MTSTGLVDQQVHSTLEWRGSFIYYIYYELNFYALLYLLININNPIFVLSLKYNLLQVFV